MRWPWTNQPKAQTSDISETTARPPAARPPLFAEDREATGTKPRPQTRGCPGLFCPGLFLRGQTDASLQSITHLAM